MLRIITAWLKWWCSKVEVVYSLAKGESVLLTTRKSKSNNLFRMALLKWWHTWLYWNDDILGLKSIVCSSMIQVMTQTADNQTKTFKVAHILVHTSSLKKSKTFPAHLLESLSKTIATILRIHRNIASWNRFLCIGNSMICSDIWHKYHEWYFKIVIRNFTSL